MFCHLRQLRTVRRSLTDDAAKTMVHSSSTGSTTVTVCFMGCRLFICAHYRMSSTPRPECCWRWRSFNILLQPSAISSTGCVRNNVWSSSMRYSCTRSSSNSSTVPCRHVSTRVNEFYATPSSLGRSRRSCEAAMQNNKIRKAKFSRVCSINLELTTDDRSRRFYLIDQFQSTFESLNCFAELTEPT